MYNDDDLNPVPIPPRDKPLTVEELRQIFGGDWRALAQIMTLPSMEETRAAEITARHHIGQDHRGERYGSHIQRETAHSLQTGG